MIAQFSSLQISMKAIIPIVKRLTKEKIVLELQIKKLLKIHGTQIPQKPPSFSAHKQQVYIPLCTHILNHFSYSQPCRDDSNRTGSISMFRVWTSVGLVLTFEHLSVVLVSDFPPLVLGSFLKTLIPVRSWYEVQD